VTATEMSLSYWEWFPPMNSIGKVFASGSVGFQTLPTKILAYESLYPSRAFACLSQS